MVSINKIGFSNSINIAPSFNARLRQTEEFSDFLTENPKIQQGIDSFKPEVASFMDDSVEVTLDTLSMAHRKKFQTDKGTIFSNAIMYIKKDGKQFKGPSSHLCFNKNQTPKEALIELQNALKFIGTRDKKEKYTTE